MARIRKYTAQRPMEVIPTGAKAWPEAMSRESGAMAGFGGTVMSVAQKWQAERDNSEISRILAEINNFQYTSLRQLEDDWRAGKFTDASQFEQVENDYVKARDKLVSSLTKGKRGLISDRVNEYAEQSKASDTANFYRNLFPKEKEFRSVQALKEIENYKQQGDRDKAVMAIEQNKYWLGLEKSEVLKSNLDADMAAYQHQNFLEQVAVDTREMPYDEAITFINQIPRTAISEPERNGLIAQRKRQEEIATATTNPMVKWETLRKLAKNPASITDEYLESLVRPNSLTGDDIIDIAKIRDDKDSPLKTPTAELYMKQLDYLYANVLDKEGEPTLDEIQEYDTRNNQLRQYFESNPKATPQQAREYFSALIHDKLTDEGGILSRIWQWNVRWRPYEVWKRQKGKKEIEKRPLTSEIARQYLNMTNGDRKRAEQLAQEDGYEW